jgi:hypothetical protein
MSLQEGKSPRQPHLPIAGLDGFTEHGAKDFPDGTRVSLLSSYHFLFADVHMGRRNAIISS